MSEQHPLIAEQLDRFGVVHPALGRNLRGNRVGHRRTADNDPIGQSGEVGPISHQEQEKRLADTKMWVPHRSFAPASIAVQGARGYASKIHLPDPHAIDYSKVRTSTADLREVGRAYDALPTRDPTAIPHFERMRDEVRAQHEHLTNAMGIRTEVVDHDPYPTVHHMVQDVRDNKRIKVLSTHVTGGHDFLSDEDNDKFRAVHDVFGHAATGRSFDAHGEEAAWHAHARMFTPNARGAMSSETRGQNTALHINGTFQAQKTALLPRHLWGENVMNRYSMLLPFEAFLKAASEEHRIDLSSGDGPYVHYHSMAANGAGPKVIVTFDHDHDPKRALARAKMEFSKVYGKIPMGLSWSKERSADKTALHAVAHDYDRKASLQTYSAIHIESEGQILCGADLSKKKPFQFGERECPECRAIVESRGRGGPYYAHSDMGEWNGRRLSTRKVAHDSGDGETIYHCPFCGSGQVIARSDQTIECEFCHTCFTVQVQPQYPAFPQTIDGQPVQVPGMPGQVGVDSNAPPPGDDQNPFAQGGDGDGDQDEDGGNPFAGENDQDQGEDAGAAKNPNPFAKGSALRTTTGADLPVDSYLMHLALKHTADKETTLAAVRARRG